MGRPSAIAHVILDWLRTPGPDGELVPWKVTELSVGVGAAASTVGQQLGTLSEAGLVERAGNAHAPRGVQPQLWRAVETEVEEEDGHAPQGAATEPAEVTGGPSDEVVVDDRGRSRTPADTHEEVR